MIIDVLWSSFRRKHTARFISIQETQRYWWTSTTEVLYIKETHLRAFLKRNCCGKWLSSESHICKYLIRNCIFLANKTSFIFSSNSFLTKFAENGCWIFSICNIEWRLECNLFWRSIGKYATKKLLLSLQRIIHIL